MLSIRVKITALIALGVCGITLWCRKHTMSHSKYALIVGCNSLGSEDGVRYQSINRDTSNLSSFLLEHEGYTQNHVTLINETTRLQPTRPEILNQIDQLVAQVQEGDQVSLFFIGHGFRYKGEDYFTPNKTDLNSSATVLETAIPIKWILIRTKLMRAKEVVTFFEMCRPDHNHTSEQEMVFPKSSRSIIGGGSSSTRVRATVYSCLPDQISQTNSSFTTGVFSSFLLKGLRGQASNSRGEVSLSSLLEFMRPRVFATTRIIAGESQVPQAQVTEGTIDQASSLILSHKTTIPGDLEPFVLRSSFSDSMFKAYKELINNQPTLAAQSFDDASKLSPTSQLPFRELEAMFRSEFRNKIEALQVAKLIVNLALHSNNPMFKWRLAQMSQQQCNYHQAEHLYLSSGLLSFRKPANLVLLGFLRAAQGDRNKAIQFYLKSISIDPKYSLSYLYMAPIVDRQGESKKAEELYRKAVKLNPKDSAGHYNLAMFLARKGRYNESVSELIVCTTLKPTDVDYHVSLAILLWKQDKWDEARFEANTALLLGGKTKQIERIAQSSSK